MRNIIFLALIWHLSLLHPQENTMLSAEDLALASLPTLSIYDKALSNAPADITFAIADLKYDHGKFKIIECGNATYSGFRKHPLYINNKKCQITAPYWDIVEHTLNTYNVPLYFIGGRPHRDFHYFANTLNNKNFRSFETATNLSLISTSTTKSLTNPKNIREYEGIIIQKFPNRKQQNSSSFVEFKKKYPTFLLVNGNSTHYFHHKDATYALFNDAGVGSYVPRYARYPTRYDKNLAATIIRDLAPSSMFIIKPVDQARARGVGLVSAANLDAHLQCIFGVGPVEKNDEKSVGYWRTSKDTHFLASEFVPSQTIMYHDKIYHPTLRIAFLMTHETGIININIMSGYWKIPPAALENEQASLSDRYITDPDRMQPDGFLLIEQDDLKTMKAVVAPVLAQAYKIILEKSMILD